MVRIVLLGGSGQLGRELAITLTGVGEVVRLDRTDADFLDPEGLMRSVLSERPDVVVNAAAYTAVDRAEAEPDIAHAVNATAVEALTEAARASGALLVHYSTDYVFDGSGSSAWTEQDHPGPINAYGRSKLAGEEAIRRSGCDHLILRVSWLYGRHGGNFLKTMLRLMAEREAISVVSDQFGAPTDAAWVARVTADILPVALAARGFSGTYHLAPSGETTWFDYARLVLDTARVAGAQLKVREIVPVASADYPTAARRPFNSRLDISRIRQVFGVEPPDWQSGVVAATREIIRCG